MDIKLALLERRGGQGIAAWIVGCVGQRPFMGWNCFRHDDEAYESAVVFLQWPYSRGSEEGVEQNGVEWATLRKSGSRVTVAPLT